LCPRRNEPEITFAECKCFIPCNPCALDVIDHVEVLYFDRWVLLHLISSHLILTRTEAIVAFF
jgi:hypothetical protein